VRRGSLAAGRVARRVAPAVRRAWWLVVLALLATTACGSGRDAGTATSATSSGAPAPAPAPSEWLGLNYNSSTGLGRLDEFSSRGIVYDRAGQLEPMAGTLPEPGSPFERGLANSVRGGMDPDVVLGPAVGPRGCTGDPNATTLCLPTSKEDIDAYVYAFIATATAVRRAFPERRIIFEPMNEPWDWASPPGTPSGRPAATQYAAVLAALLPAIKGAGIPLRDIYVPGDGVEADGTSWITDLYEAQPCLAPGPRTCGPIEGWNVHSYGLPGSTSQGIGAVPGIRATMISGRDNVIVSELGFCSSDSYGGEGCGQNTPTIDGPDSQTTTWLKQSLQQAQTMHRQGWLKALILWDRGGDAWGMQNENGSLTAEGLVLTGFAATLARP
jgi:hypothetical protein